MLLEFHPDVPGRTYDRPYKFLGYWHSVSVDQGDGLPVKTGADFDRYEEQLGPAAMPLPSDYVDESWDKTQREKVVNYLNHVGQVFEHWRGYSWCRFSCGERNMGTTDFSDGTYVWPAGFGHYVEKHGVKPPQEFIDHVLRRQR
jgi:hypothetical protein